MGSPLKKARPSIDQTNAKDKYLLSQSLSAALEAAVSASSETIAGASSAINKVDDEEL